MGATLTNKLFKKHVQNNKLPVQQFGLVKKDEPDSDYSFYDIEYEENNPGIRENDEDEPAPEHLKIKPAKEQQKEPEQKEQKGIQEDDQEQDVQEREQDKEEEHRDEQEQDEEQQEREEKEENDYEEMGESEEKEENDYDEVDERDEIELEDEHMEEDGRPSNQSIDLNDDKSVDIEKLKSYQKIPLPIYPNEGESLKVYEEHIKEDLDIQIIPSAKNVTPDNTRLVIYNRVPKCGSTTVNTIIKSMQLRNKFYHRHSTIYNKHWLGGEARKSLLQKIFKKSKIRPQSFDRHIYYFNVTRLGLPKAAWINLVREPVSRFISQFYFTRSRSRWQRVKFLVSRPKPPKWWFDMKLDDCIKAERPECFPHPDQEMSLQLTFFCGHHPECRKVGSKWALHRAKRHVESYYSVVGLLEELPLSLSVLEGYLPKYFKNVRKIPMSSGGVKMNVGESKKKSISNSTKEIIKGFLKEDIEFYDFVRQRLYLQAKRLGLLE
ncbi:uronyl 2-sulfotransferase-like [Palaemon carinicauda]|uniref:uronyl 2-sulfotransferase-like n=1 Tax=Palaemon carinicauda TaxID=392227 RepID=UPI0035B5C518